MRAIVTGQVGMEKKGYLNAVARLAGERGDTLDVYHVGDMMYREAPDVRAGRILDLPLSREQQVEWAILDTFDALAPAYDDPQTPETVSEWFRSAGMTDVRVRIGGNGVLGNGEAGA